MSLKNIINNSMAAAGSIFWVGVVQLVSVPIFVSHWGVEKYGIWVMLSVIPTYIALSDFGLTSAATSAMAIDFAKNNIKKVEKIYSNLMFVVAAVTFSISLAALILLQINAESNVLFSNQNNKHVMFVLILYACVAMISRVFLAKLRACGQYAAGTIVYDFSQFCEGLLLLLTVANNGEYLWASLALLLGRVGVSFVMYSISKIHAPILNLNLKEFDIELIKFLVKPALAALTIPTALSVSLQGTILVAGSCVSPMHAAILSASRTISRIGIQLVGVVNRATVPEFSAAYATRNKIEMRRLININIIVLLCVLLPASVIFALYGNSIISLWTKGKINPDSSVVQLLAVAMFFHGIWYFSSNILLSANKHMKMAIAIFAASILTIVVSWIGSLFFGLNGVIIGILIGEFILVLWVIIFAFGIFKNGRKNIGFFQDE